MAEKSERSLILFPVFNPRTPTVKAFENIDATSLKDRVYFYSPPVNNVGDVRSYLNDDYSFVLIEAQRGWKYYLHFLRTSRLFRLCQEKTRKVIYVDLDVLDSVQNIVMIFPLKRTVGLTVAQLVDHKHILDFFFQLVPHKNRRMTVWYRSQEPSASPRSRIEGLTRHHLSMAETEIKWNGEGATYFELKEKSLIVLFEPSVSLRAARYLQHQFYPNPLVVIPLTISKAH